jgi:parvulin-like peptidyl-prolyl isomerase
MFKCRVSSIALLVLAVLAVTLAGCGRKGLIRVNGEKISKDAFYARLEMLPVNTQGGAQPAGRVLVQQMISEELTKQFAKKKGVAPTEADINKKVQAIKKNLGGDFKAFLLSKGLSEQAWKEQLTIDQARQNVFTQGIKVPEADIKKGYNQLIASDPSPIKRPEQIRMSVIMTKEQSKIDKVYSMLKQNQEFSTVAMKLSDDPMAKQSGGQIGTWLAKNDQRVPKAVLSAAFALGQGEYSKPFQASGGWIVVKLDQKRPVKVQTYDEVKDMIREQLALDQGLKKNGEKVSREIQEFVKSADITVNAERFKDIGETIKKQAAASLKNMPTTSSPIAAPKK